MATAAVAMATQGVGVTLADAFSALPFLPGVALRRFEPALVMEYPILWPEGAQAPFGRPGLVALLRAEAQHAMGRLQAAMPPADG